MMCGIGYDAWVVNGVNLGIKERFGKLAYVLAMLGQIRRYGERQYRVTGGRSSAGLFLGDRDQWSPLWRQLCAQSSNEANILRPQVQVLLFQKPGVRFCCVA